MKDIIQTEYSDEMQKSYLDYSMSVITDRAVPDVRDGLKPVQRRTIYAMYKLGLDYNKPHRKSARIVGDTMGKYHPHGDTSIYDSLVVMQQEFKKKIALVDGHGNFGSVEGDGAAAMRYTEARLHEFTADVYLRDIDKDTVDFRSNFDETEKEPVVLPSRLPMAVINGAEGIAVGMTTSIPSHNLDEVIDAMLLLIDKPNVKDESIYECIKGPDFPIPCTVMNADELARIYSTGTGKIRVKGTMHYDKKDSHDIIVIDGLPPSQIGSGMEKFLEDLVSLSEKKLTNDILDISNQTDQNGIRIIVEIKKGKDRYKVRRLIESKTKFCDTFAVSMLVIEDNKAKIMSLKDMLLSHIKFLYEINRRKFSQLLEQKRNREEILEGLIRAVDIIDLIIEILRGSNSIEVAKNCLINGDVEGIRFKSEKSRKMASKLYFTKLQADAILDMKLSKLINLEILALNKEYDEVLNLIKEYEKLLKDEKYLSKFIKKELKEIKKKYSQKRITSLENIEIEKFEIKKEAFDIEVVIDDNGYIKSSKSISSNSDSIILSSEDRVVLFTSAGRELMIKATDIPDKKNNPKGVPLEAVSDFDRNKEKLIYACPKFELNKNIYLCVSSSGIAKRTSGEDLSVSVYKTKFTTLEDEIIYFGSVKDEDILALTKDTKVFKTNVSNISMLGRNTKGSKLVTLKNEEISKIYILGKDSEIKIGNKLYKNSDFKNQKLLERPKKLK